MLGVNTRAREFRQFLHVYISNSAVQATPFVRSGSNLFRSTGEEEGGRGRTTALPACVTPLLHSAMATAAQLTLTALFYKSYVVLKLEITKQLQNIQVSSLVTGLNSL